MPNLNHIFSIAGDLVLPVWLLLIFAPRWRWTQRLAAFVMPLLLAAVYAALNILRPVKKLNVIRQNRCANHESLISMLNPIIRGWTNYHRHISASSAYRKTGMVLWHSLWRFTLGVLRGLNESHPFLQERCT